MPKQSKKIQLFRNSKEFKTMNIGVQAMNLGSSVAGGLGYRVLRNKITKAQYADYGALALGAAMVVAVKQPQLHYAGVGIFSAAGTQIIKDLFEADFESFGISIGDIPSENKKEPDIIVKNQLPQNSQSFDEMLNKEIEEMIKGNDLGQTKEEEETAEEVFEYAENL